MGLVAPLIVVVGPTAAGKSALAVAIAEWCGGEVVSADAFQVYRGLDIGTAKVGAEVTGRVAHHCIDIADPDEPFSAGRYAREAAAAIAAIRDRGRGGLAPLPRQSDSWRTALEAVEARRGTPFMYAMLEALDPDWADVIGAADRQRLLRGLEVTLRQGRPMSAVLRQEGWTGPHYDAVWLALTRPRPQLYQRIEARVDRMLADGWVDEVRGLLAAGYAADAPGLRAIGYRELVAHLQGDIDLSEARAQTIGATRRYAKRQLTWFRHQCPAVWHQIDGDEDAAWQLLWDEVRAQLRPKLTC